MNLLWKVILILCFPIMGFAHQADEAYFNISTQDSFIEIVSELPWTIRNSLIKFAPYLDKAKTKQEFLDAFFQYIKKNIILEDEEGHVLQLLKIQELPQNGFTHQSDFLIQFKGSHFQRMTNTVLFNLFPNQKNYHVYNSGKTKMEFVLSQQQKSYILNLSKNSNFFSYKLILVIASVVFILLFLFLKNKKSMKMKFLRASTKIK